MADIFTITPLSNQVTLNANRQATVVFTVTNNSGRMVHGLASLATDPEKQPHAAWLTIEGEAEQEYPIAGLIQIKVNITVPAETSPGTYNFRLNMVDVSNTDETFCQGQTVTIVVREVIIIPWWKKFYPWWIIVAAVIALVLIILLVILLTRKKEVTIPPVVGTPVGVVQTRLTEIGLTNSTTNNNHTEASGIVYDSNPTSGTKVPSGSNVELFVSKGPGQVTVRFKAVQDKFWYPPYVLCIFGSCPDFNYGPDLQLFRSATGTGGSGLVAIQFMLNSIPAGATIQSASLQLSVTDYKGINPGVTVSLASSYWSEGGATAPNCSTVNQTSISVGPAGDYVKWDVTALVNYKYHNPAVNNGFCLTMNFGDSLRSFGSRENPNPRAQPVLSVTYTP